MRSGLVRLMIAAVLVMASAVVAPTAARAMGCPVPDCLSATTGIRLHEDDWAVVQVWTDKVVMRDLTLEIVAFDITTSPGDYRLMPETVTIRAGQRSAEFGVWIADDQLREQSELFGLRIGPATTQIEILDGRARG